MWAIGVDKAGEAKLGADEVRTGRLVWFHQSRKNWFTLLLIKSKGDFSEICLGAWNLKVLFLDVSISPSLKLDVSCFVRK